MNSFGRNLRLTTFGESHGVALGGVLDGMPAGFLIDREAVQRFVDLRRPGYSRSTTKRREPDEVIWLSGLTDEGRTLGSPIAFVIQNKDARSQDYATVTSLGGKPFRANHADLTYWLKYGLEPQPGGGRSSGRETVARVVAGAVAQQWLEQVWGVTVQAFIQQVGALSLAGDYTIYPLERTYDRLCYCPDATLDEEIAAYLTKVQADRDSVGGVVGCVVRGMPAGVGEPIFDRIPALLSYAVMSIPGSRAFAFGDGIDLAGQRGSAVLDELLAMSDEGTVTFGSNHNGGALGGITTGQDLSLSVAFKPTPTIARPQQTLTTEGERVTHTFTGRHDPCIALRAVPVVQSMVALTLADLLIALGD
ncbi:chorismate synthase [Porphyromonas uenonis]|uniref:chorismate synthase n=1 Tax=Porphyromonas uenonis TaxID=281920 RepID=UPI00267312C7|nr:chorismate synthase [Porphyromonas uenonis]